MNDSKSQCFGKNKNLDIAIVGIACRFPGAEDAHEFWKNLCEEKSCVEEVPADSFGVDKYCSTDNISPEKKHSLRLGLIGDIARFDNQFFSITPREASVMDPQQRILLEESWHCIEDSGIYIDQLRKAVTSVFIGIMALDYLQDMSTKETEIDLDNQLGNYSCGAANRISFILGLHGKSIALDTACAASLTAIHEARNALTAFECDYAIAGAAKVISHSFQYTSFNQARLISASGYCRPFDEKADGFVPGEGVGVLLLQRLDDAIEQNNHIYGVIKGSAVNHSGNRSKTLSSPNLNAQESVILSAYQNAGIDPKSISYVEAHCVGTVIGDAVEVTALSNAFGKYTDRRRFCKIGSVKSNIGHLESAAGMAGVIKILMMMLHREVPRTLHVDKINPLIDSDSPFEVAKNHQKWQTLGDTPLRAGISAFGFTGSNAHLVVESKTPRGETVAETQSDDTQVFLISAKTSEALDRYIDRWIDFVDSACFWSYSLKDICLTQMANRTEGRYRWATKVKNKEDLREALSTHYSAAETTEDISINIHFGSRRWLGHEQLKSYIHGMLSLERNILSLVERASHVNKKIADGYCETFWDEDIVTTLSFVINYGIYISLTQAGLKPHQVSFGGEGTFVGLVAAGVIEYENVLRITMNHSSSAGVEFCRPAKRFYDHVNGRVIHPGIIKPETLDAMLNSCDDREIDLDIILMKSGYLYETQYAFKKNIYEWSDVFRNKGFDITRIIKYRNEAQKFCNGFPKRKVLLHYIISGAIRKFSKKWGLLGADRAVQSDIENLYKILDKNLLSKETLFGWMYLGVSLKEIASFAYHDNLPLDEVYSGHTQSIATISDEIGESSRWLKLALSLEKIPCIDEMLFIDMAPDDLHDRKASCCSIYVSSGNDYLSFCIDLWLAGISISWQKVMNFKAYNKVSLPTYPFGGSRFWLEGKKVPDRFSPENIDVNNLSHLSEDQLNKLYEYLHR